MSLWALLSALFSASLVAWKTRFQFGDLIDLSMLDTRLEGRDEPLSLPFDPARNDPERRLISDTQMQWLLEEVMKFEKKCEVFLDILFDSVFRYSKSSFW